LQEKFKRMQRAKRMTWGDILREKQGPGNPRIAIKF